MLTEVLAPVFEALRHIDADLSSPAGLAAIINRAEAAAIVFDASVKPTAEAEAPAEVEPDAPTPPADPAAEPSIAIAPVV